MRVLVLGAGPCGLTAAWELAKAGVSVTVLEKERTVGGLCRTVRSEGYQFDLGGHRFISRDGELVKDVKALMSDRLLTRPRKSVIRFRDREFDYPINLKNVMRRSSMGKSLQFLAGYILSSSGMASSRGAEGSFEHWIDSKFGKSLNDYFFKPYTEKLWGIPASELSDDWAAQRISILDVKDAFLKALKFSKTTPRAYATKYLYPKGGIGEIFESMTVDIERLGGKVLTGVTALSFNEDANKRVTALVAESEGFAPALFEADHFLSTIPVNSLMDLLNYQNHPLLPFRSLRFLNIKLSGPDLSSNTWMYVPEGEMIMTRIQEPKRRSPYSVPTGKTSVMLEIPCQKDDFLWNMPDDQLLEKVAGDMKSLGFDISDRITGYFSTRAEHAYPRYDMGYKQKVLEMIKSINTYENLDTLGREGLFRYIFMDTAMLMGRKWARAILLRQENTFSLQEMDNAPVLLEAQSVAV